MDQLVLRPSSPRRTIARRPQCAGSEKRWAWSCPLEPIGTFTYRAELDAGLIEHELVHLFRGVYDGAVAPNPSECDGFSWSAPEAIQSQIRAVPHCFSAWFVKYADAGWPVAPPVDLALPEL